MGKVAVFTRYICLNRLFLYQQLGFQVYFTKTEEFINLFGLENLVKVLAHELSHTILTDLEPKSQECDGGHGTKHDEYMKKFLDLISKSLEHQELKRF